MRKKQTNKQTNKQKLAARAHLLPLIFYLQEKRAKLLAITNPHL